MADVKIAKLPKDGHGQVVLLPPEFRFEGDEVYATRDDETGNVTLSTRQSKNVYVDFIAYRDSLNISDEEADEYGKIMDEIIADRSNHIPNARGVFADELDEE